MANFKRPIGVVGLGLMGTSIATCFVSHGFKVIGLARRTETAKKAAPAVRRALEELRRHDVPNLPVKMLLKRFQATTAVEELAGCQLVVETIVEKIGEKRAVIAALEKVVSPTTVIASNTSAIPVTLLQKQAKHPGRVIGMHWAEPAHITRFMEIICGKQTLPAARRLTEQIATRCGKEPSVLRKDIRGFITNRIMYAMLREAFHLVESGVCSVEDVDRSLRNDYGWWMTFAGPFRFMDLTGIEAYELVMRDLLPELSNKKTVPALMRKVVASGAKGVRNAKGFYRYTPAQAKAWEHKFIQFSHDIRKLALRYPEHGH